MPSSEESIPERQAKVVEQIRLAQKELEEKQSQAPAEDKPKKSKQSTEEIELLKQLGDLISQQSTLGERTAQLETELASVKDELGKVQTEGIEEKPPFSFLLLESLEDSLTTQTERANAAKNAVDSSKDNLSRAKEALKEKEIAKINAKEAVENNKDAAVKSKLALELKLTEIGGQIAEAKVELRRLELKNDQLAGEIAEVRVEILKEKLALVTPRTTFSADDLDTRLAELQKQEERLLRAIQKIESDRSIIQRQLATARTKLQSGSGNTKAHEAAVAAHNKESETTSDQIGLLNQQLEWVRKSITMWNSRYRIAKEDFTRKDLKDWEETNEALLKDLESEEQSLDARLQDMRKQLSDLQREIRADEQTPQEVINWLEARQQALRSHINAITDHTANLDTVRRLATQLDDEINDQRLNLNVKEWANSAWQSVLSVWNYILIESPGEDSKAIRVSTIIKGVFLLVIGIWVSRKLSQLLGQRMLPKFGVHEGAASALQSLSFYAFVLTSALMALKTIQIPLTLFTFLGGAAAIGLGFGSQNVLNNFISGIIMLVEQPVRVGDLVELLGLTGTVETIGMRSTRIRTPQNQEMIVPNSSFLENNVQNWTLTDSTIRCKVPVGVAYGSPTREVARWLKQAAEKHGMIRNKPEPFVWFTGFGDNSLNFELHFFIVIRTLAERMRIESDLRFMIDQYFRDAGITIAFPQRDVHIDTERPLEVRMLPPKAEEEPLEETAHVEATGTTPAERLAEAKKGKAESPEQRLAEAKKLAEAKGMAQDSEQKPSS
ncbi:MAG: mechanosensitive ion channel [Lacipirellulaceae bacterium]